MILCACEESQMVCTEFRRLGAEAYSCDIIECSGAHPEWHIQGDVIPLLNGNCKFKTMDGALHSLDGEWEMIIAFPPCTHLAVSGARYFETKRNDGRQRDAIIFFGEILNAKCKKVAVENPVNIISGNYIKKYFPDLCDKYGFPIFPSQKITPWQFGDNFQKTTCLWLKGLPLLHSYVAEKPNIEYKYWVDKKTGKVKRQDLWSYKCLKSSDTGKVRSKTFKGVAKAMAEQWLTN